MTIDETSTTLRSLQILMGRARRPMGKLLLRVTIRVQTKGCYRVLCLSFRMLLVERAGLCSLTRACVYHPDASSDECACLTR